MSADLNILFAQARKLTADERADLAELLLETLEQHAGDAAWPGAEFDRAWATEAERRWSEHVASGAPTLDAVAAIDDVRQQLRRDRQT